MTGNPDFKATVFAYRPKDERYWWAEWYQFRALKDPNIPRNFFPILSAYDLSWQPGEKQTVAIVPGPDDAGKAMDLVLIDDSRQKQVARIPFRYQLPVTRVEVNVGDWRSSLYRVSVARPEQKMSREIADVNTKLTNIIVRPRRPSAPLLFVVPTDMWFAYSTNGGHDYHGWRTGYDGSVGYSPTVISSRRRRLNNFYYSLYDRYTDIHHFRYLEQLSAQDGFSIDFATQHDVALDEFNWMPTNWCSSATIASLRPPRATADLSDISGAAAP